MSESPPARKKQPTYDDDSSDDNEAQWGFGQAGSEAEDEEGGWMKDMGQPDSSLHHRQPPSCPDG